MKRALLGCALSLLAWVDAKAQEVLLAPSAAVQCLVPAPAVRGIPRYPQEAEKLRVAGSVKVELSFMGPNNAPRMEVIERQGDDSFVEAVREHVSEFRVPCHDGGTRPVRLQFEFVFKPDDRRVHWSEPVDADDAARRELLRCVKHISNHAPSYPRRARELGVEGRVIALLRFSAPDQPPTVRLVARPSARSLLEDTEDWARGYRMPCHSGGPVESAWTFLYRFKGQALYGFKELTLRQFIGASRGFSKHNVQFDLSTMDCPFEIRVQYRQPLLPNLVGEVGSSNPARRPFLAWLQTLELELDRDAQDAVFGDTVSMAVPCLKIDLKPKE